MTGRLETVCIIGSGNWGSAISTVIGNNVLKHDELFSPKVHLWVFEETYNNKKLTEWINNHRENPKYLPGIELPSNLVASSDLQSTCRDSTLLVFVVPHQFIKSICDLLVGNLRKDAIGISLIKGFADMDGELLLISEYIQQRLGISMSALSGANLASGIATKEFSESTIGVADPNHGEVWRRLFHTNRFVTRVIQDKVGLEICGALKNVVAMSAGTADGLKLSDNTKAALIRIGMTEIMRFTVLYRQDTQKIHSTQSSGKDQLLHYDTYFESCGIADLIATCFGGRNRKLAELHAQNGRSFEELESDVLNGQKLQGPQTVLEVCRFLEKHGGYRNFPLFTTIYELCHCDLPPIDFLNRFCELSHGFGVKSE